MVINLLSYKVCKLFPNVLCVYKPFPAIYAIFTRSLKKCKRGVHCIYLISQQLQNYFYWHFELILSLCYS
jgi:hypothetical protein